MNQSDKHTDGLDLGSIRSRLDAGNGPRHWRSLEELAGLEEVEALLGREFPPEAAEWTDPASRRTFLRLMGASLALAGAGGAGCGTRPPEKIVPYVRAPEELVPGRPLWFATALSLGGLATGVLVKSVEGRPIKVEGNEKHPDSLGAVDLFSQAAVLTLYDPDRSQVVTRAGTNGREVSTWELFLGSAVQALDAQRTKKGAGLRILTETVTSPTLARQIDDLLKAFPEAVWHQYEPTARDNARRGAQIAFGEDVATRHQFDRANVIVSLDADFLAARPGNLHAARQFAARREPSHPASMNRLYVIEPSVTVTGSMADHRLALRASEVPEFAQELARRLEVKVGPSTRSELPPDRVRWLDALAKDLKKNEGASLVLAGDGQPPIVHALAHAMNHALKNVGKTVVHTAPVDARPVDQSASLRALARDLEAGRVEVLLILGGNPAYDAPVDLNFPALLAKVPFSVHLALYEDETSALCRWHAPQAHELESWGDLRAFDGTVTIRQPLITPLYGGRSAHEILAVLTRSPIQSGYEIVRATWKDHKGPTGDREVDWRTAVHDGLIAGTAHPAREVTLRTDELAKLTAAPVGPGLEIVFRPDPTLWDGRFANNGWLQELPKPLTKLTWENAALISPKLAEERGLLNFKDVGDVRHELVELHYEGRVVIAPVLVTPGQADDSVTIFLGHGRTRAGHVGSGVGFNAYRLRTADAPDFGAGLDIQRTGRTTQLASTQHHRLISDETGKHDLPSREAEKRELVRVATLADFLADPHFAHEHEHEHEPKGGETLYPPLAGSVSRVTDPDLVASRGDHAGHAWAMAINLNACTGCTACVVACQAENNIPVVGKTEVLRGREMHWLEIDRYYHGGIDNPEVHHQPRLCMHCENAPCELVCPVAATVHDHEGLNNMIYNRCVGTRYCSNNCPYKVRHFNFLQYSDQTTPSLTLLNNPEVTVRARGVMEKCSYCVQRINAARYAAETDGNRPIKDGEIVTACQGACPTRAIVFGDVNDPNSAVSKLKDDPRNYAILGDLNTRPRTTYLAKLRNPNPDLEESRRDVV
jgi:molybdopterin-containing oxidoreductase family iron-sulfur binding subunit